MVASTVFLLQYVILDLTFTARVACYSCFSINSEDLFFGYLMNKRSTSYDNLNSFIFCTLFLPITEMLGIL